MRKYVYDPSWICKGNTDGKRISSYSEKIKLEYIFDYVDISSRYLKRMVREVAAVISRSLDFDQQGFGPLHEGRTSAGEAGEVTEDGIIYLDTTQLRQYPDEVAKALIAHELAHFYLGHYQQIPGCKLKCEDEADEQAKKWGFDIDEFRRVCGPATLQE